MRMRIKMSFVVLLVVLVTCARVYGQGGRDVIELGGVELFIGMPQDTVLARLSENYSLHKLNDESWYVLPQGTDLAKFRREPLASLYFRNNRLRLVDKTLEDHDERVIDALYVVISNFEREGRKVCSVGAQHKAVDTILEGKVVSIACGRKGIRLVIRTITSTTGKVVKGASLYEVLGDPREWR